MSPSPKTTTPEEVFDTNHSTEDAVITPSISGLSTFLSCNSANAEELVNGDGIEQIDIVYGYEFHTTEEADLSSSVNRFEHDLLNAVADDFGLSTCEFIRGNLRNGTSSVVGIDSYPGDMEDTINTVCEVDVDSIEKSKCNPMNGYMTAWVSDSDNRHLSEADIYTAIENYSNNYATDGEVLAVSYIGTRHPDGHIINCTTSNSLTYAEIAGIVFISVGALALISVLALNAKKRRDRKNAVKRQLSIVTKALFMIDDDEEVFEAVKVNDLQKEQKAMPMKTQHPRR